VLVTIADSDSDLGRSSGWMAPPAALLAASAVGRNRTGRAVFGVPHAAVVNAAFCHPHPLGASSTAPTAALVCGAAIKTAKAEVDFTRRCSSPDRPVRGHRHLRGLLADFSASFHDLRNAAPRVPIPTVRRMQARRALLDAGSLGVIIPACERRWYVWRASGRRSSPTAAERRPVHMAGQGRTGDYERAGITC
jgi:hypothetical protein